MNQINGPYAALLTPFSDDGQIDFRIYEKEIDRLSNSRLAGLFPCGTSGEFIHMDFEEKVAVVRSTVDVTKGRKPVVPGACATTERDVIKSALAYGKMGCESVVICPPWYIPVSQEGIVEFYKTVASAIGDMGIVIYNIPMCSQAILTDTFEHLLDIKNVVAVKDSSGNLKQQAHLLERVRRLRPEVSVLNGVDECMLPALAGGCVGSMTALGGIMPDEICDLYEAFHAGDVAKAQAVQMGLMPFLARAESLPFPTGYKRLAASMGQNMGISRRSC